MPTTLDSWYDWAFKLDWQYRQEQAESRLLHPSSHVGSKFGKSSGSSSEKGKALIVVMQESKAQPLATAVTLPSQGSTHASDAMDVDQAGRRPPIKCFNCGKLGHTSRFCKEKRIIRAAEKKEKEESRFVEESQCVRATPKSNSVDNVRALQGDATVLEKGIKL